MICIIDDFVYKIMMGKSCFLTFAYLALLGILVYKGMWIWLMLAILIGGFGVFIMFFGLALESGFRSKFPLDFLVHTGWVNRYFEDKGFELIEHNTANSDYPESIYKKGELKIVVRLNAPIMTNTPYTITVIAEGEQKKEWNIPVEKEGKAFEIFDEYFNSRTEWESGNSR